MEADHGSRPWKKSAARLSRAPNWRGKKGFNADSRPVVTPPWQPPPV